jgi:xanthine/uracil/vitamin C permease (AzgA family)
MARDDFRIAERGSTPRREILGGVTTFVTMAYNIANGLTARVVVYPLGKIVAGRARELNWDSVVLALLSLPCFVFGLSH